MSETEALAPRPIPRAERRRTVIAASAGNFVEWYDWGIYGVVATIIGKQFFPPGSEVVGLLSAYAIFATSYLMRPIGSAIFGHIGDKLGRRRALSLTIIITCTGTALIGCVPGYRTLGFAAPVLLLLMQLIQSFGTGGEYATAISFVYEHGRRGRKATAVGSLTAMTFVGFLVGSLFATILSATMPADSYEAWGWRVLFWLAVPMGIVGLYLRRKTEEGEEFRALQRALARRKETVRSPFFEAMRTHWRRIGIFVAFLGTWAIISATLTSYLTTFLKNNEALSSTQAYAANTLGSVMIIVFVLLFSPFADRLGLRRATIIGSLVVAVGVIPGFALAGSGVVGGFVGAAVLGLCKGVMAVPSLLAVSQIFPARIRVTAGGLSYNIAQSVLGGTAPLIAVWLNSASGTSLFFASYLVLAALVTLAITLVYAKRWIAETADYSGDVQGGPVPAGQPLPTGAAGGV
ncbi:MAG: MFS transporter [Actinocatenispora sp.]